ncbi:MAG TPA: MFS transporter [Polyangia bacterium]|jgi:PAT family beta-lactamase induction signal transducer AmpG|nr:MFS transporter [Polyangia bacterium]
MPPRSKRALLWTSTTYFGEGLPWSFLHQMGTEFLTAIGASKTQIGSTSLLHLAVTFKFAWSPVLDLFGKRRTWLWALQIILGLGMFAVAALAPSVGPHLNLTAFWLMLSAMAVVHATHDIACDGFYLQALDKRDQALYSGTRLGAYRLALIVGSSALVYLAGRTSWLWGFGVAGALMIVVALVNAAVMPHPLERNPRDAASTTGGRPRLGNRRRYRFWRRSRRQRWDGRHRYWDRRRDRWGRRDWLWRLGRRDGKRRSAKIYLEAFLSFLTQPQAALVLGFLLCYRLGDIMMFAMSKPLLRDLGVDTAHRGLLNGFGTAASILGVVAGGAFVARRGLERSLTPLIYLQNLGIPLYIGMAVWKPHLAGITAIVLAEQLVGGFGMAGATVFLMQRCRRAFSASHFAMATSVVSLASTFSGYASGPLNERLGHPLFFTVAFLASIPSLVLVLLVPKTPIEVELAAAG